MLNTIIALGVAGLLLLFLEMFVPGLIAGIIGAVLLIASVAMAYSELGPEAGNIALLIAALGSAGLWWWWATQFQHTRFGKSMTLQTTGEGNGGQEGLEQFAGKHGTAATPLRPGGTIIVEGKRLDAMTDGDFLETGTSVRIVRTSGMGVVVRRV